MCGGGCRYKCVCVCRGAGLQIQMCLGGCIHIYGLIYNIYMCVCVCMGGRGGGVHAHS